MRHFFVISNYDKDIQHREAYRIQQYLESKSVSCHIHCNELKKESLAEKTEQGKSAGGHSYLYTNPDCVPAQTECIISVGGDGTLIQAARDLVHLQIPIIGINFGTLGYLAQEREPLEDTLDKLIEDDFEIQQRMMLEGEIFRDGYQVKRIFALNDIVLNRTGDMSVMDFQIRVNESLMTQYKADGMIVCTPTGSTAYNLSAGGPIVEPCAKLMVLTPICAHTLNTRSVVLSSRDDIEITMGQHGEKETAGCVAFDGVQLGYVRKGDCIRIRKSKLQTKMIKLGDSSFMEVLRQKMRNT